MYFIIAKFSKVGIVLLISNPIAIVAAVLVSVKMGQHTKAISAIIIKFC